MLALAFKRAFSISILVSISISSSHGVLEFEFESIGLSIIKELSIVLVVHLLPLGTFVSST